MFFFWLFWLLAFFTSGRAAHWTGTKPTNVSAGSLIGQNAVLSLFELFYNTLNIFNKSQKYTLALFIV
jgi:hypothetical protein